MLSIVGQKTDTMINTLVANPEAKRRGYSEDGDGRERFFGTSNSL
jgi:hypothetical protein